ncbi:MAG TPA: hypothetical protein VF365_05355 [Candidatus Limnocylindria bacterium]
MNRRRSLLIAATFAALLALPGVASAHNRGLVWLPSGECVQVGALNEVYPGPDKSTKLDLDPITDGDNFGTSWAATRGGSALEKGACP